MIKRLGLAARNVFIALTSLYGLSVSVCLLLRVVSGESIGLVGLFISFVHVLIVPSLVLLPLFMATRHRWIALLLIVPFILTIVIYAPRLMSRAATAPIDGPRLSILSYNINGRNLEVDHVLTVIQQWNADLVAIQELSPWMAEAFAARLQDLYPYQALHPQEGFAGQGILSRYPITADDYWQINLGHQRVQLEVDGTDITFYNTHPLHPLRGLRYDGESRTEEVMDILKRAAAESGPLLIVGDFNLTEFTEDYARITRQYSDAFSQVGQGLGFTFPNYNNAFGLPFLPPLARIDYVFHNAYFQADEAQVGNDAAGSDHFPLFVGLAQTNDLDPVIGRGRVPYRLNNTTASITPLRTLNQPVKSAVREARISRWI